MGPAIVPMMVAGTVLQAVGTVAGGIAEKKAADFEAKQLERAADAEQARGSRVAAEEARQKRINLSRAQAVGAASGAGRDFRLEGELEREGAYRSMTAVWEGGEAAAGRRAQASAARARGKAARAAGFIAGAGNLASGLGSTLKTKYGGDGAQTDYGMY